LQVPHTKHAALPFGKSIEAPSRRIVVLAVTTGIQPTPSAASAGSMKNPNPSETTSTGMPASRARSATARKPGSCGWAAAFARSDSGSARMRPTSHAISRREPTRPASYSATQASHSPVTNSAMSASETSVWAMVPS
jgi:hypothetical protein